MLVTKKLNKKGIGTLAIVLIIIVVLAAAGGIGYWIYTKNIVVPPAPPVDVYADELTLVYNEEQDWNTLISIDARNFFDPDRAVIAGLTIYIYQYGSSPLQLAAKGIDIAEAVILDSFTTGATGTGISNRNFEGKTKLTAVAGLDTSTNKSELKDFVVQGQNGDSKPTSISCGIFYYKVMSEETETAFTWTDAQGSALTTWNYTTDSDGILEAKIKLVMDTTGECLRNIWNRKYGDLQLMLVVKVTHQNYTTSAAIDIESSFDGKGTPSNQLVFVISLDEIAYQVDSSGSIVGTHESYRYFTIKLDFTGCGITHTASQTNIFSIGGWCLIEQSIEAPTTAGLPSGDSANWFQDAISALQIYS